MSDRLAELGAEGDVRGGGNATIGTQCKCPLHFGDRPVLSLMRSWVRVQLGTVPAGRSDPGRRHHHTAVTTCVAITGSGILLTGIRRSHLDADRIGIASRNPVPSTKYVAIRLVRRRVCRHSSLALALLADFSRPQLAADRAH